MYLKRALGGAAVAIPALAIDRLTKIWAVAGMQPREIIPGVVGVRYAENTGAAFSMLSGMPWLVNALSVILVAAVIVFVLSDRSLNRVSRIGLWLVVAGGIGNIYDRLAYGYVVDFIEVLFMNFAIFNVADICVCCGAALTALAMLMTGPKKNNGAEVASGG